MRQPIQVVLGAITLCQCIQPLSQQLHQAVADLLRVARIIQASPQRLGQPQPVVSFTLQKHACIGGQPIVPTTDLDGPVERGLEHPFLSFTHVVTPFVVRAYLPDAAFYGENEHVKQLRRRSW